MEVEEAMARKEMTDDTEPVIEKLRGRTRARQWLLEIGVLCVVVVSLWGKQVYFHISQRATWSPPEETFWQWSQSHLSVFSLSLAILMLLFGGFPLLPRLWRFGGLLALNIFLTTLVMADLIHARFFGSALSVLSLSNTHMIGMIAPSIIESMRPEYAILYLDVIVGALALPFYLRACREVPALSRKQAVWLSVALLAPGLLFFFFPSSRLMKEKQAQAQTVGFQREICSALGLFPYHFWDAVYHLGPGSPRSKQADLERVTGYLSDAHKSSGAQSELFGVAKGKNLILMSAESLQAFPIGLEVEGQAVMPRLSEFIKESLYFSNFYDQTYQGSTSDGEFIALNSLHPLSAGYIPTLYNANFYYGLPMILGSHGYVTLSACGAPGGAWNMKVIHPRYGFQQTYYDDSFKVGERINGDWMADRDFFAQVVPVLQRQKQPFMAFMLSSSSHGPYKIPEKHRTLKLGKLEGTYIGDYLHAVRYFDQSFGEFIERLRKANLLDGSVIAVYGDHKGTDLEETAELPRLIGAFDFNEYYKFKTVKRVPFFIRLPHGAGAKQITSASGHLDIAPTLLSLLGFSAQEGVMLGKDLTRESDRLVVFRDGSFADEKHFYISQPDPTYPPSCYESETGKKIACDSLEGKRRAALERLEISDLIISSNLILDIVTKSDSSRRRNGVNALINPGFEEMAGGKPTGWKFAGDLLVDSLGFYAADGKAALRSNGSRDVFYQTVTINPDRTYLLKFNARAMGPEQQARVLFSWLDAQGELLEEQAENFRVAQRWDWHGRAIIPPPRSASVIFYVGALDPSAVWFDNLFFGEIK